MKNNNKLIQIKLLILLLLILINSTSFCKSRLVYNQLILGSEESTVVTITDMLPPDMISKQVVPLESSNLPLGYKQWLADNDWSQEFGPGTLNINVGMLRTGTYQGATTELHLHDGTGFIYKGVELIERRASDSTDKNAYPYIKIIPHTRHDSIFLLGLSPEMWGGKSKDYEASVFAQINAYSDVHATTYAPIIPETLGIQYQSGNPIKIVNAATTRYTHISGGRVTIGEQNPHSNSAYDMYVNGHVEFRELYGSGAGTTKMSQLFVIPLLNLNLSGSLCNNTAFQIARVRINEPDGTAANLNDLILLIIGEGTTDSSSNNTIWAEVRLELRLEDQNNHVLYSLPKSGFDHEGGGFSPQGNHYILGSTLANATPSNEYYIRLSAYVTDCHNFSGTAVTWGTKGANVILNFNVSIFGIKGTLNP
jgi:hypothetical protein